MVNGHMALELALQSFDFPEGSEVITTPFTFISTTHAIVRNRLKPVFCDVKFSYGTIDETKIENLITEKTVAILPVHVYGNVIIGEGTFIGVDAAIKEKTSIGKNAILAMGAIVFTEVQDYSTVVGNPARVTKANNNHKVFN